ncbi:MAG: hypothetical protein EXR05_00045 [Acetobacteraceae bacterium]|nr:hypothetical protein [Acetobacteraceae bacterium]
MDASLHESNYETAKRDAWSRPSTSFEIYDPKLSKMIFTFLYFERLCKKSPVFRVPESVYGTY